MCFAVRITRMTTDGKMTVRPPSVLVRAGKRACRSRTCSRSNKPPSTKPRRAKGKLAKTARNVKSTERRQRTLYYLISFIATQCFPFLKTMSSITTTHPKCTGQAAEALEKFLKRQEQLKLEGRKKPDMIACKELWSLVPDKCHGEIPGVPIGLKLGGRGEAAILGLHTKILSGIDALKDEPCYAVVLSGGYVDDKDEATDGTIYYTGSGGQKGKRQVKDQVQNCANKSLLLSMETGEPIRVLRGTVTGKPEYFYEGLFVCTAYEYTPSQDGPMVYKFTLKPIPGRSKQPSIKVHPVRSPGKAGGARNRIIHSKSQNRKDQENKERERKRRDATKVPVNSKIEIIDLV